MEPNGSSEVTTSEQLPPEFAAGALTSEEKQWAMFCHLSSLLGLLVGGLTFIGPLVCWLLKKDTSKFVDYHGKESLNFQLNILVYFIISLPLMCVIVGFVTLPAVLIYGIVAAIIAGIRASEGVMFKYPFIVRVIK